MHYLDDLIVSAIGPGALCEKVGQPCILETRDGVTIEDDEDVITGIEQGFAPIR